MGTYALEVVWWSMIFSENRCPSRIKSGTGIFGIMLKLGSGIWELKE
jgi:hypothetical protein